MDSFWQDAEELFEYYMKAYQSRMNHTAWLNGLYSLRALESAIHNAMPFAIGTALSGGKIEPYPYFDSPIDFSNPALTTKSETLTEDEMRKRETAAYSVFK